MASIRFFIRNKSTSNETPINLKVYLPNRKELAYSTGLKIAPRNWDIKNQKVRNKVEVENVKDDINGRLSEIRAFIEKVVVKLKVNENFNQQSLKQQLNIFFNKEVEKKKDLDLFQFIDHLVEKSKKRVSKVTWKTYERTKILLKDFQRSNKISLSYEKIDIDFYYRFIDFLEDSCSMSPNTVGKQIKNIKFFMNSAYEEGFTKCNGHKHKHFKVIKEESFQIYLNEDELTALKELELEFDSVDDRVRDLFLIGAYTGQRISDWKKLNLDNIITYNEIDCFKIKQTKTKTEVVIPIHPVVNSILKKRDGNSPKYVNEQDINEKIKIIAEKAKIKSVIKEKGNLKKWELVSTHTARRSFCTNAYKSGMDSLAIMQLSGHKTEKSFLTYIKISKEEFAVRISNHKFFK